MASLARLFPGFARFGAFSFAFALALAPALALAVRDESPVTEESVKAAFLYKFPGYIEWPAPMLAAPDEPVVIGAIGADDVAAELLQIAAARKPGRPLVVRKLRDAGSLGGVHILFIGASERARADELIRIAHAGNVLTVTEWDGALRQGSIINFVSNEGRVRFEVSLEPAEKSGLRLSSRLLAVAHQVFNTRP